MEFASFRQLLAKQTKSLLRPQMTETGTFDRANPIALLAITSSGACRWGIFQLTVGYRVRYGGILGPAYTSLTYFGK